MLESNRVWIGEEVDSSGTYENFCKNNIIFIRRGGCIDAPKLFMVKSPFFIDVFYISDEKVTDNIVDLIEQGISPQILEGFVYKLIIGKLGFLYYHSQITRKFTETLKKEKDKSYENGRDSMKRDIKNLLE